MIEKCMSCGAELTRDEIGIHKKMVNRRATEFLCLHCLAVKFNLPESDLYAMIERYRKAGCAFFDKRED
jgi:hypothetical protein